MLIWTFKRIAKIGLIKKNKEYQEIHLIRSSALSKHIKTHCYTLLKNSFQFKNSQFIKAENQEKVL